jgi:ketosteroid isomerase-like protein
VPHEKRYARVSKENVETVLEIFRLGAAGSFDRLAALLHPDVRMDGLDNWPEPGPFIGFDAVVAEFKRVRADWTEQRFEDIQVIASDRDWVVTEYRWHVRSTSGLEADFDFAVAAKFIAGRIGELHFSWTRARALEAAGLSE